MYESSGTGRFAIKSLNPKVKVYGVQAAGAPSMYQSIHEHKAVTLGSVSTVADGIAVKTPGDLTFDICSKYVDDIALVSEDEICAAILRLLEENKMVAEGAGAVSVAAAMFNKVPIKGKKTICLVSGGNIDVNILNRVVNRGLDKDGRICTLTMELADKPGQLLEVIEVLASLGANVLSVHHERGVFGQSVNACELSVRLETRNHEHVEAIKEGLQKKGFNLK